ncbi:hypothetical protein BASA60_004925 [Batrachochytrium salamandrivorans]|nr:hypothetical protein BASA60_004925 [Batrachochytrium salamandrivorans]
MKLISFAVISFLAITVSALPASPPDAQDVGQSPSEQQHQSTSSQDPQQSLTVPIQSSRINLLQSLQATLQGLIKELQETQAEAASLQNSNSVIRKKISTTVLHLDGLNGYGNTAAFKQLSMLQYHLTKVKESQQKTQHEMDDIRKRYADLVKEIDRLDGAQND